MLSNIWSTMDPFDCNASNSGVQWTEWQRKLEQLFLASEIQKEKSEPRINVPFYLGGSELCRIHDMLSDVVWLITDAVTTYTDCEKTVFKLSSSFNPQRNMIIDKFLVLCLGNNRSDLKHFMMRLYVLVLCVVSVLLLAVWNFSCRNACWHSSLVRIELRRCLFVLKFFDLAI
jgi:hypothetical protein